MPLTRAAFRAHILYNLVVHGARNRYARLALEARVAKPRTIVEVGLWRGDRALELIAAARASNPAAEVSYFGFDLFENMPAELVAAEASRRTANPTQAEVMARLNPHLKEGVRIQLFAGNTLQTLPVTLPTLPPIDFAFIDGGHSYETVKSDWESIRQHIHVNSVVVFDDFVNEEAVLREGFGINRLMAELDRSKYQVDLLGPVDWWERDWGVLKNQLARVKLRERPR